MLRVVLDTNVLISLALAQRGPLLELREAWEAGRFGVLVAPPLLNEVRGVLERPKIATRLSRERRDGLLLRLERLTEPVACLEPYPEFPDPADSFLLAMVRDGGADVLVTGDGALLALGSFGGAGILSARAFAEHFGGAGSDERRLE